VRTPRNRGRAKGLIASVLPVPVSRDDAEAAAKTPCGGVPPGSSNHEKKLFCQAASKFGACGAKANRCSSVGAKKGPGARWFRRPPGRAWRDDD